MSQSSIEQLIREIARAEALAVVSELQAQPTADDWLTVKEISALTKFSEWTIYEAIKQGELEAFRPSPRRVRARRSKVMEWARRKEAEEKAEREGAAQPK